MCTSPLTENVGGYFSHKTGTFPRTEGPRGMLLLISEVPLHCPCGTQISVGRGSLSMAASVSLLCPIQGYLDNKKQPPRRTLRKPYAQEPMVILGGWVFLMREVPLYGTHKT